MRLRTEVEIAAPVEQVWAILADLDRYPDWNPFTVRVDGRLEVGAKLRLSVMLGGKRHDRSHVVSRVDPPRALCWTIRTRRPWLIRGERCQTLEPLGPDRTRYVNDERVDGLLAPIVQWTHGAGVARGLAEVGGALRAIAERG